MLHRLPRTVMACLLLIALALTGAPGVTAQGGADLSVSLSGPSRVKSGAIVQYTVTVTNAGPETATGIFVGVGMGDQFDPVSVECNDNGSMGSQWCNPDDLAAGASATATMTIRVCCLVRGETRNAGINAQVSAATADPNEDNNFVSKDVYIVGGRVK